MKSQFNFAVIGLLTMAVGTSAYGSIELSIVEGVFGLSAENETTAVAFWIPLGEGESVSGIEWFNNDGNSVFPEVLVVAGDVDFPESIREATPVAFNVSGYTLGWSELYFEQPLATTAEGIFVIWRFPSSDEFVEAGNGAGFGIVQGLESSIGWFTTDGKEWNGFTAPHQVAMASIMSTEKSSNVLVLTKPSQSSTSEGVTVEHESPKKVLELSAYPNPFNPSTVISFCLKTDGFVDVSLFDIRGRLINKLDHGYRSKGVHQVTWEGQTISGRKAPSGVYLAKVAAEGVCESIRITLAK
jgi:hypothetical protein